MAHVLTRIGPFVSWIRFLHCTFGYLGRAQGVEHLGLILKSDADIVEETGRRNWTARQAVAVVCLVVFAVVVANAGWGSHLFLATVPLGCVSVLLKLRHSSLEGSLTTFGIP